MASSASIEQCTVHSVSLLTLAIIDLPGCMYVRFTGGKHNSLAISVFLIFPASSNVIPLTSSVKYELLAIALPQPNVLNLTSEMVSVSGSTLIWSFMTSPHAGAPTRPVPTSLRVLSIEPTLRGDE